MKKQTIIVIAILVVGAITLPSLVSKNTTEQVNAASLEVTESFFDFGEILLTEGLVETKYELINTGDESITIGKVYTSCMCTTASVTESDGNEKGKFGMPGHKGQLTRADSIVAPGENITVTATFDPAAHGPSGVGLIQRSVYLETDSNVTPKIELRFKALVKN